MQSSTDAPKLDHDDYVWAATRLLTITFGGGPFGRHITVRYDYRNTERGLVTPTMDMEHRHLGESVESALKRTMDDESAKRFEERAITFGIHAGMTYRDIPISYLTWVADNAIDLQAYLRSERGKRRIENDD